MVTIHCVNIVYKHIDDCVISVYNNIEMARDAIGLAGISMEDNEEELPVPSDQVTAVDKVKKDTEDIDFSQGVLTYVDVDFSEYRKKVDTKQLEEMLLFQVG